MCTNNPFRFTYYLFFIIRTSTNAKWPFSKCSFNSNWKSIVCRCRYNIMQPHYYDAIVFVCSFLFVCRFFLHNTMWSEKSYKKIIFWAKHLLICPILSFIYILYVAKKNITHSVGALLWTMYNSSLFKMKGKLI